MDIASTSHDETPSIRVDPEPVTGRIADNMDESPSPGSSYEAIQRTSTRNTAPTDTRSNTSSQLEVDPELAGLDALEDGRPGERPAYPFTTLIRYAIKGSPNGRLLLEDIYNAIQTRYPYFATAPSGWKNSVRHTLSLMTCFEKVPRLLTEPGKGSYWTVNDSMPHAKPSRIRIRKRKTRTDDDDTLPGTPRSVSDPLRPELPGGESPQGTDRHRRLFPHDHSGAPARRHSTYTQACVHDQFAHYNCNVDGAPRSYHYNHVDSWAESDHPHAPTESRQNEEHDRDLAASRGTGSSRPIDYRSVLMSDLEKMRDAIGRRDDIDDEWCRTMVEQIRGTGLI
ncbi:unnamed protein product [Rhizoctonia solani]|uniref:Fork-head domain-containing protein n=1 Tax=Rhizoctonia solani TaxID=456999 RepID=A0A8H3B5M0_9AGAM|nr:unnamed protein product [Rhizoctonia solani]